MSRFFSVLWAFELDIDPTWTAQEVVLDWMNAQFGTWVDENVADDVDGEAEVDEDLHATCNLGSSVELWRYTA